MMRNNVCLLTFLALLVSSAAGQTVSGSGTANTVPVFTGTSSIGNSPIVVSGSNVGIGVSTPPTFPFQVWSAGDGVVFDGWGNHALKVDNISSGATVQLLADNTNTSILRLWNSANHWFLTNDANDGSKFKIGRYGWAVIAIDNNDNVGIGTTTPQARLEINGNLRFTSDGSVQTTAWTGVLCGGDYAEDMKAAGRKASYQPGDVLVLASDESGDVKKSAEPYSTLVAGVYSTKPGVIGRRESVAKLTDNIPMAMVGVVPTKVNTENGPIRRGDLLVTSSVPGYAMKGTNRNRMFGAVIGKAMGSLDSGNGVIEVLVTLQ